MNRTRLGPAVVLLPLALALSLLLGSGTATANRTPPGQNHHPNQSQATFTEEEAKDVLAQAKSQLRRETKRVRAQQPVGDGVETDITMTLRDLFLARTALSGQDRREADAILARPSETGGDDFGFGAPVAYLPETPATPRKNVCGPRVCVHWVESPADPEHTSAKPDSNSDSVPDSVQTTLDTVEHVWDAEVGGLGYRDPLPDVASGDTNNPNTKLDIYLAELGDRGLYGYCAPEGPTSSSQVTGYCVLDNDYDFKQYGAPPLNSLRVTAAHEFFHAIQFGYDVDEDLWFMEGTATWAEDEVYDSINDNYQFLATSPIRHPRTPLDYEDETYPYGSFIFFRFASERSSPLIVRRFWESAEVSGRTSLQAIYGIIGASVWPTYFATFGSWNTLPPDSYSERAGYPTPFFAFKQTLSRSTPSTGWRSANVGHLGNSPGLVAPSSTLSTGTRLLVEVNGPNRSLGSAGLLQRRYLDGRVSHTMIPLNSYGNASTLVGFNRTSIKSITLILSNTARSGSAREFKVRASLR